MKDAGREGVIEPVIVPVVAAAAVAAAAAAADRQVVESGSSYDSQDLADTVRRGR